MTRSNEIHLIVAVMNLMVWHSNGFYLSYFAYQITSVSTDPDMAPIAKQFYAPQRLGSTAASQTQIVSLCFYLLVSHYDDQLPPPKYIKRLHI